MPHSYIFVSGVNMLNYLLHIKVTLDDFPVNDKVIKRIPVLHSGFYKFNSGFMFHAYSP